MPARADDHLIDRIARSARLATLVLLAYWLLLFLATHLPGAAVAKVPHADKPVHFFAYAGLSFLLVWAGRIRHAARKPYRAYGVALLVAMFYGAVDELLQIPVPGRTGDVRDWLADTAGAFVGLVAFAIARAIIKAATAFWATAADETPNSLVVSDDRAL